MIDIGDAAIIGVAVVLNIQTKIEANIIEYQPNYFSTFFNAKKSN